MSEKLLRTIIPFALGALVLLAWEEAVAFFHVAPYVLPAPSAIAEALVKDFGSLIGSLWATFRITLAAFALALVGGVLLAILLSSSRVLEMALYPYAVILQVTPIVAIAPLILIWVGFERIDLALLILAWIVAFFPILSNTTLGLRSADRNLIDLFRLHGATRWQVLTRLRLPTALPYLLAGMKVSGGLALIGTVVAEFAAGTGTATGLAWRIVEAGNRLQIAKMFAALFLLSCLGVAIFVALQMLENRVLRRWHESALPEDA